MDCSYFGLQLEIWPIRTKRNTELKAEMALSRLYFRAVVSRRCISLPSLIAVASLCAYSLSPLALLLSSWKPSPPTVPLSTSCPLTTPNPLSATPLSTSPTPSFPTPPSRLPSLTVCTSTTPCTSQTETPGLALPMQFRGERERLGVRPESRRSSIGRTDKVRSKLWS